MPFLYGLGLGFIAWLAFTVEPVIDTTWLNEMLGLSKLEATITSMFFIVGIMIGTLARASSRISSAHDRLVAKVYGLDDH